MTDLEAFAARLDEAERLFAKRREKMRALAEDAARQRFLDAAALAALPSCLRALDPWGDHSDEGLEDDEWEDWARRAAIDAYRVADAMLAESERRRAEPKP